MPNFTGEVKKDLLRSVPEKRCCRLAVLSAFLATSGSAGAEKIEFTIEKEEIAEYVISLFEETFGISMTVTEAVRDPKYGRSKLTFAYSGDHAGEIASEIATRSAPELTADSCCVSAYLKGAFLGGGSCTLPHGGAKTGYHLEFVFRTPEEAENFRVLLDSVQLIGNIVVRGEKHVVYCKSLEIIGDFLSFVEAKGALRRLEEVASEREENNNSNRVSNCYAGNADKSAIASAAQIVALEKMKEDGLFASLSAPLRATAECRMQNPADSLQELAEKLGVSKSCFNHRLRKLMKLYENSYERKG